MRRRLPHTDEAAAYYTIAMPMPPPVGAVTTRLRMRMRRRRTLYGQGRSPWPGRRKVRVRVRASEIKESACRLAAEFRSYFLRVCSTLLSCEGRWIRVISRNIMCNNGRNAFLRCKIFQPRPISHALVHFTHRSAVSRVRPPSHRHHTVRQYHRYRHCLQ